MWESPRGIVAMAKELDRDNEVSKFELQSRYCPHFRTNTLMKGEKNLIPQLWIK